MKTVIWTNKLKMHEISLRWHYTSILLKVNISFSSPTTAKFFPFKRQESHDVTSTEKCHVNCNYMKQSWEKVFWSEIRSCCFTFFSKVAVKITRDKTMVYWHHSRLRSDCPVQWEKVFESGLSKFCGRQLSLS